MTLANIPEPQNTSPVPDSATKKGLPDHTGKDNADGRVLHVNLGIVKYGTDDKAHAAAMVLSVVIILFLGALLAFAPHDEETKDLIGWLKSAVLLTIGVAIGQGASKQGRVD